MSAKLQIRTRAIVLRTNNFSEADRFCTLLSPELGLIETKASGARRSRSPLLLATEFLTLADFELFYYKDRYSINSADLVYGFPAVRSDVERLTCASHLSEIIRDLLISDDESKDLYELVARAFSALEKEDPSPLAVVRACELRLMRLGGFGLDLGHCVHCQKVLDPKEAACFDFMKMGLACAQDSPQNVGISQSGAHTVHYQMDLERKWMDLSAASLAAIDWFSHGPLDQLFSFKATAGVEAELNRFNPQYIAWNLDKRYSKLDFIQELKQMGEGFGRG